MQCKNNKFISHRLCLLKQNTNKFQIKSNSDDKLLLRLSLSLIIRFEKAKKKS